MLNAVSVHLKDLKPKPKEKKKDQFLLGVEYLTPESSALPPFTFKVKDLYQNNFDLPLQALIIQDGLPCPQKLLA